MFIAYLVVVSVLSPLLIASAGLLLAKEKGVTATMTQLGVPLRWFPLLAVLKIAGALGLLAGIFYRPLGIAAAVGVVLYFAGATVTHLLAKDVKGTVMPTVLTAASTAPLLLGLASL
ncbi:DoxX family protein [Nonomuraea sp. SBT364]|uniref:DoxX family protein n=1 Tax=Nonomuraea sp. SBT364 TaxID=1580530 RepID=UPI00069E3DF3|nr:DoxX family protein [Nonomuraea sp. SBT364]